MLDQGQYEYETDMLKVGRMFCLQSVSLKRFYIYHEKKDKNHAVSLHSLR